MVLINTSYPLPPDVFSVIIDILAEDRDTLSFSSLQALMALSVTCRLLLEPSRKRIFRGITIRTRDLQDYPPNISFEAMERVLDNNPSIANYVRTLNCQLYPLNFEGVMCGNILRKLGHLRSLTLMPHERIWSFKVTPTAEVYESYDGEGSDNEHDLNYGINARSINWRHMPQDLRHALGTLINLPTLTSLNLTEIVNFPTELLAFSCGLQALNISTCRIARIPPHSSIPSHGPIQLQELRLNPGAPSNVERLKGLLPGGVPVLDFSQVREMSFTVLTVFDELPLGELLASMLQLDTLTLTIQVYPESLGSSLATHAQACLDNLRNLRIRFKLIHDDPPQNYLFAILKDVSSFKMLESVDIRMGVYTSMTAFFADDLRNLARDLSTVSKFSVLKYVSIAVCLENELDEDDDEDDDRPTWLLLRTTHLASLSNSETVHLSYSVDGHTIV